MSLLTACQELLYPQDDAVETSNDDLSDVDLNHPAFRAAFPDGNVPIKYGIGNPQLASAARSRSVLTGIFLDEYERATTLKDACGALGLDVDELARVRDEFLSALHVPAGGDRDVQGWREALSEQRSRVGLMMRSGMTLRQIARYLEVGTDDLLDVVLGSTSGRDRYDTLLEVDELLASTALTCNFLREYFGLHHKVVTKLSRLRRGLVTA